MANPFSRYEEIPEYAPLPIPSNIGPAEVEGALLESLFARSRLSGKWIVIATSEGAVTAKYAKEQHYFTITLRYDDNSVQIRIIDSNLSPRPGVIHKSVRDWIDELVGKAESQLIEASHTRYLHGKSNRSLPSDKGEEASSGSCFFVSDQGLFVTNYHVVENRNSFIVEGDSGGKRSAELVKVDPANDLALLQSGLKMSSSIGFAPFGSLSIGDKIFTMGFPATSILGDEPKFTDGVVSAVTGPGGASNIFQMTVPLQPGNSGGPVVNESGQVVGIATSTAALVNFLRSTGTLPQNVNWAVKSDYARLLVGEPLLGAPIIERSEAIAVVKRALCRVFAS